MIKKNIISLSIIILIATSQINIKADALDLTRKKARKLAIKNAKTELDLKIKAINKELDQVRELLNATNTVKLTNIRIAILPEEITQLKIEEWQAKKARFQKEKKYLEMIPKIDAIIDGLKKKIQVIKLNREWDKLLNNAENKSDKEERKKLINRAYKNELAAKKLINEIKNSNARLHVWETDDDLIVHATITPKKEDEIKKKKEELARKGLAQLKKTKSELRKKFKNLKEAKTQLIHLLYALTFKPEEIKIETKIPEQAVIADIEEWKTRKNRFKKEKIHLQMLPKIDSIIEGLRKKIKIIKLSREQDAILNAIDLEKNKEQRKEMLTKQHKKELEIKKLKNEIKNSGSHLHVWQAGEEDFYL